MSVFSMNLSMVLLLEANVIINVGESLQALIQANLPGAFLFSYSVLCAGGPFVWKIFRTVFIYL